MLCETCTLTRQFYYYDKDIHLLSETSYGITIKKTDNFDYNFLFITYSAKYCHLKNIFAFLYLQ